MKNYIKKDALEYFIGMCGFDRNVDIGQEEAYAAFEKVFEALKFNFVVSYFGKDVLLENIIVINHIKFSCEVFKSIPKSEFLGIYLFALTVGNLDIKPSGLLEELYFDMSGTSFVDAARDFIRKKIINIENRKKPGNNFFISDSFGPGFYGMGVEDVQKFFRILDCGIIGISLSQSGVIVPQKSCVGFFVVTKNQYFMKKDCKYCIGDKRGCFFCKFRK